eukprot:jgi/Antlo1/1782/1685
MFSFLRFVISPTVSQSLSLRFLFDETSSTTRLLFRLCMCFVIVPACASQPLMSSHSSFLISPTVFQSSSHRVLFHETYSITRLFFRLCMCFVIVPACMSQSLMYSHSSFLISPTVFQSSSLRFLFSETFSTVILFFKLCMCSEIFPACMSQSLMFSHSSFVIPPTVFQSSSLRFLFHVTLNTVILFFRLCMCFAIVSACMSQTPMYSLSSFVISPTVFQSLSLRSSFKKILSSTRLFFRLCMCFAIVSVCMSQPPMSSLSRFVISPTVFQSSSLRFLFSETSSSTRLFFRLCMYCAIVSVCTSQPPMYSFSSFVISPTVFQSSSLRFLFSETSNTTRLLFRLCMCFAIVPACMSQSLMSSILSLAISSIVYPVFVA